MRDLHAAGDVGEVRPGDRERSTGRIHGDAQSARHDANATEMVAVFVGEEQRLDRDAVELRRGNPAATLTGGDAAVDQHSSASCVHERGVPLEPEARNAAPSEGIADAVISMECIVPPASDSRLRE